MKSTEIKMLWKLVNDGEERPLAAAELRLLMRLRAALMDYADETRLGHPAAESRCLNCEVPVSQCGC